MNRPDLRTVPRYFLNPPLPAIANGAMVRLVDLSVKGARIELEAPCQPGEQVDLMIVTDRGNMNVRGKILWCEIDSLLVDTADDRYLAGVSFAHHMPNIDMLLDEFCERGAAVRIEDSRSYDRYRVTAPLTGSFGEYAPVSLLDISIRGAKIACDRKIDPGVDGHLRFQVDDETGPIDAHGRVVWSTPSISGGIYAGLLITGQDDVLRAAIHRLCVRNEARIDLDTLRRKFDQLRTQFVRQQQFAG